MPDLMVSLRENEDLTAEKVLNMDLRKIITFFPVKESYLKFYYYLKVSSNNSMVFS